MEAELSVLCKGDDRGRLQAERTGRNGWEGKKIGRGRKPFWGKISSLIRHLNKNWRRAKISALSPKLWIAEKRQEQTFNWSILLYGVSLETEIIAHGERPGYKRVVVGRTNSWEKNKCRWNLHNLNEPGAYVNAILSFAHEYIPSCN